MDGKQDEGGAPSPRRDSWPKAPGLLQPAPETASVEPPEGSGTACRRRAEGRGGRGGRADGSREGSGGGARQRTGCCRTRGAAGRRGSEGLSRRGRGGLGSAEIAMDCPSRTRSLGG